MIFLTVGTQLPFDRLVQTVDQLAAKYQLDVSSQIGESDYQAKSIQSAKFFAPDELDEQFRQSELIISHAGMGTIINCLRIRKPLIIFPRLAQYQEHRNDHQLDTLNSFSNVQGIYTARDEQALEALLSDYQTLQAPDGLDTPERDQLAQYILSLASA
ncbi:glycosyltransferase [Vibrio sp. MEBiC08052]|uniref:glycosyltransferase n=1 Tax=Vibrio sp. MEBiC08052 TaxID=1761910 RepID=UPI0007408506|nr:glycosyltransferase [Vibrio sp. MEBiC08052]KUJ00432.1 glycosyltransferase family 28 protein [Vibrio sp. MEBiC08052]